ncbi:hypothetical protein PHYSODRAFT_336761 [Phytophthora sojae]|uniref:Uncharacterized protein n=1 Tax=Phytophthora sojae (strain P6497) TaxID=1094619 RepID=G4ZW47_PHYSP|nr:hypothetical protein PHYSODRAFT_336761 [Phytophthora sojae]EGZ12329.1 hypothetical protein PHYSODRAFT_336761 [Phytophthora sojae]|eukprot:XP_009532662.1 hypothetical protein PHYSODRAFT_336761 [Phytophthora sojae]
MARGKPGMSRAQSVPSEPVESEEDQGTQDARARGSRHRGDTKCAGEGEELKSTKHSRGSKGTTDGRASSSAAVAVVVVEEEEEEEMKEVERVRQAAMTLQEGGRSSRSRRGEAERTAVEEEPWRRGDKTERLPRMSSSLLASVDKGEWLW